MEAIKERCVEFGKVVAGWNEAGIPIGMSDLRNLAVELRTPIPVLDKDFNLIWNDEDFKDKSNE